MSADNPAGKGDTRRPTDHQAYRDGWERTFGSGSGEKGDDEEVDIDYDAVRRVQREMVAAEARDRCE